MNDHHDLEEIHDALDDDRPADALRLAERALRSDPGNPELMAAAGWARLELDDPESAAELFESALEIEPGVAEWKQALAAAAFAMLDFDRARALALDASESEESAWTFDLLSRLADREGNPREAEHYARRANLLEPETYPLPVRMSEEDFQHCADEALGRLPDEFRSALEENLTLMIEPVPPLEVLAEDDPPFDPGLLGLYTGIPLPDREPTALSGSLPDRIYLFQRNLERAAANRRELIQEIAVTLYHEIGHFLGLDEEELEELDFG
jgi:predicted Zn-dependent protease with MMP-like domain